MQQESGKFYEHSHRLLASLVGFTSLALAIHSLLVERRVWVKWLPWVIGIGVAIQAVLGGTRVTETSVDLAIVHGVFAQLVFAGMAVFAAATSGGFRTMEKKISDVAGTDRFLTLAFIGALVVQLILGAVLRHRDELVLLHISMAVIVTALAVMCGFRAWGLHGTMRPLHRMGLMVLCVVVLQLVLGVLALSLWTGNAKAAPLASALFTTLHQMNGAVLLASAAVLAAWTWRLLGVPEKKGIEAGAAVAEGRA
jgi:cytochrome c oxidase assembly protein subunit 15